MFSFLKNIFSTDDYRYETILKMLTSFPPELYYFKKQTLNFSIIKEFDFVSKIAPYWANPGIDTSYFAVRVYDLLIPERRFINEHDLLQYINSLWHESNYYGGFKQNVEIEYPSIHGIHSIIGILNLLNSTNRLLTGSVDCSAQTGQQFYIKKLGTEKVQKIIKFIAKCQSENGGFSENPQYENPAINTTASALWCLWHLGAMDLVNIEPLISFVKKMWVPTGQNIGYKNTTDDIQPWICSTYYALRIFMSLKRDKLFDYLSTFAKESGELLLNAIIQSKHESSGFGAAKAEIPNLIHTKDAISLLLSSKYEINKTYFSDKEKLLYSILEDIAGFLDVTYYKGAYCFADKKYFQPNMYATYLGYRIRRMIEDYISKFKLNVNYQLKEKISIPKEEIGAAIAFVESCYDKSIGAYRGYSNSPNYLPKEFINRIRQEIFDKAKREVVESSSSK